MMVLRICTIEFYNPALHLEFNFDITARNDSMPGGISVAKTDMCQIGKFWAGV